MKHPFDPIYDQDSKLLILGSFPSVRSRETGFYYGHPQNRFWKVISTILEDEVPVSNQQKKDFLLRHHIALWDVLASCEITGSSDASIKNAIPNDFTPLIKNSQIKTIITNGNTAFTLFDRFIRLDASMTLIRLPSTSAANAGMSLEKLTVRWSKALKASSYAD
jgi:TDG/mug DNA glycosylase family protein